MLLMLELIKLMRNIIPLLLVLVISACSLVHISGNNNKLERKDDSKLIDFKQEVPDHGKTAKSNTKTAKEKGTTGTKEKAGNG